MRRFSFHILEQVSNLLANCNISNSMAIILHVTLEHIHYEEGKLGKREWDLITTKQNVGMPWRSQSVMENPNELSQSQIANEHEGSVSFLCTWHLHVTNGYALYWFYGIHFVLFCVGLSCVMCTIFASFARYWHFSDKLGKGLARQSYHFCCFVLFFLRFVVVESSPKVPLKMFLKSAIQHF